jgi:glutamate--cysteine ligase
VLDIARAIVALSKEGLKRRQRLDRFGEDETHFLNSIETIVEDGVTTAEDLLERYHGRWEQNIDRVFDECAY